MEVRVTRKFRDAHTGKLHAVGDVLDIDEERLAEIQAVADDLVEVLPEKPKAAPRAKKPAAKKPAAKKPAK